MRLLVDREKLFELTLALTLAAVLFELATTYSFYVLDGLLVVLFVLLVSVVLDRYKLSTATFVGEISGRLGGFWYLPLLLLAYIVCDLLSIAYSPLPAHAVAKYKVVMLMLFLSLCLVLCVDSEKKLRTMLLTMAIAAGGTAVFTLLNYLVLRWFPIYYTLRLTLRRDYNVFATTLLLGYLCAVYLFATARQTPLRCALFAADTAVTLTVLFLSASRRVFLMLPPLLLFWLCVLLFRHRSRRGSLTLLAVVVVSGTAFFMLTTTMQGLMQAQYERYGAYGPTGNGSVGEGKPEERYETVTQGGVLTKRGILWGIAWEEFSSFSLPQKLLGKGFAYDIHLYDTVENEALTREYAHLGGEKGLLSAHNFVLADLLGGGILRAGLGLALVAVLLWACVLLTLRSFAAGALYGNALVVVLLGSLISNRYGLLYDKFFYVFSVLLVLHLRLIRKEGKGLPEA